MVGKLLTHTAAACPFLSNMVYETKTVKGGDRRKRLKEMVEGEYLVIEEMSKGDEYRKVLNKVVKVF